MSNIDAINEAAEKYAKQYAHETASIETYIHAAKSDAAKQYWYEQFKAEQKQSASDEIVKELAEWSLRYPRNVTYSSSLQPQMDGELIALEEKAKEWLKKQEIEKL